MRCISCIVKGLKKMSSPFFFMQIFLVKESLMFEKYYLLGCNVAYFEVYLQFRGTHSSIIRVKRKLNKASSNQSRKQTCCLLGSLFDSAHGGSSLL
jgi:hypothetical protein